MSKLSFRARALDASKPMPIYMAEELPDLPDYSAINRAVPQMPSGMEKEEECEHHLQRAICAGLIIPTPEVSDIPDKDVHDKLYPANYKQPRQLIHMQPFTMEQDIPDYDMDSEDERWLELQAKKLDLSPLKFEEMMDRLEKSSGQTAVTLQEAKALLKEDDDLIIAVFDYWVDKRLKLRHPLILAVKTEHRAGTAVNAVNNPYLAFRRRTEKMQTRKNRKNDETSYEKMLKLRRDLSRAVTLLEFIKRREKMKRECLHLTVEVFEKRYQAKDFSGAITAEVLALKTSRPAFTPIFHNHYANPNWPNKAIHKDEVIPRKEKRQYKKRKHKSLGHNRVGGLSSNVMDGIGAISSDEEPIANVSPEPDEVGDEGQFAFRRNKLCSYHMPLPAEGNWAWCSKDESGLADKKYRYTLTSLLHPRKCIGFARRRLGRGGRVILDRLSRDIDDFWERMDYTVYDSTSTPKQDSSLQTDSYVNLAVDNLSRTDIKSEPSAVRTCGVVSDVAADDRGVVNLEDVKREPDNIDVGVCNTGSAQPVQVEQVLPSKEDRDEMLEILQSVRKDWLHFRPKTPPPNYSPPCNLLPPDDDTFLPRANMPFSLELKSLDETDVLTDPVYMSTPFVLDYDVSMEVPVTDTRQPVANSWQHTDCFNTLTDGPMRPAVDPDDDDGVIGCSRFSVSDGAGGKTPAPKRQCFVSSTLTSPKLNNVQTDVRPRTHNAHASSASADPLVSNANGIVSQFGIEGGNRTRSNKLQPYGYSRAVGNVSAANSTLSLRTSAHTVMLNSHSANILEIPMTNDTDPVNAKGIVGQREPDVASPNNKTKTIIRKNNLVMEVT